MTFAFPSRSALSDKILVFASLCFETEFRKFEQLRKHTVVSVQKSKHKIERYWQTSILAASGLAISIAASLTVFAEGRVFLANRPDQNEKFESILQGRLQYGPSTYSKRLYLDDCLEAMTSVRGRTLPAADQAGLATACRENALKIVSTNPTFGFAYHIAALASASLDDRQGFNNYLVASRSVSPFEGWLAELRVGLADERKEFLQDSGRASADKDIATLAQSSRGIGWLARKAVIDKAFRERTIAVVEDLPEARKRAFVNAFRTAARESR